MRFQEEPIVQSDGIVITEENLDEVIDSLLEKYETYRLEVAFKFIGKGFCEKSYPVSSLSSYYIELVTLCQGGESGMELMHLPYNNCIQDTPSRFFHARSIINESFNRVLREKENAHHP